MTQARTVHYNPSDTKMKTRCGLSLERVFWRTDPSDGITCNNCVRLIKRDAERA